MNSMIRLIALDIDGVISKSRGGFYAGRIINLLAQLNDMAARSRASVSASINGNGSIDSNSRVLPPVTVITGRPATYVESLLQAIHGFAPAVFEHGTGIYNPEGYTFKSHPDLVCLDELSELKNIINVSFVKKGLAVLQGGKDYSLSVISRDRNITGKLKDMILEAGGELCRKFDFIYSSDSLNIIPAGFHKGKGIEMLADEAGVPLESILGVGDSEVDIPFMEKTGFSAAPANAGEAVKVTADYVSELTLSEGLEDILRHFCLIPVPITAP